MTADPAKSSARSPFAGCAIFICALLMIVFLIVFSGFSFFSQYKEIAKFTDDKPLPVEITSIENREAELNDLAERLEIFRQNLVDDKPSTLALTVGDLNTALAVYEPFKDLRGTFRVLKIENGRLHIAASFPLNGKPRFTRKDEPGLVTTDRRYLNGTIIATPELFENEIALQISEIQVPGKSVAKEFVERMSPYRIAERYHEDPVIGPAMKRLTGVEISGDTLILRRQSGEKIATAITDKQVDAGTVRLFKFFGIGATIFLAFVGLILFLALRRKPPTA